MGRTTRHHDVPPVPANVLDAAIRKSIKAIHTAIPGKIIEYDPASRRAIVQPLIDIVLTDGTTLQRPPVDNIPVLHPATRKYAVHIPLEPGDDVYLVCAMRGIGGFKDTFDESQPDADSLLSMRDAVAIPGFGPPGDSFSAQQGEGISVQTSDGASFVKLHETEGIHAKTENPITLEGNVTIKGQLVVEESATVKDSLTAEGNVSVTGQNITHQSIDIGKTHAHQYVPPPPPPAGNGPIPPQGTTKQLGTGTHFTTSPH